MTRSPSLRLALALAALPLAITPVAAQDAPPATTTEKAPTPPPLAVGLVSAAHPDAVAAGMRILREGGSATDAAMAMMLALSVVEPQSSGIGGGGFLVHQAADGSISTIDGRETAPAAAAPTRFTAPDGTALPFRQAVPGGKSVGVPGNIALMAMAHEKWGKLPWKALFEPAIQLADGGFEVNAPLAATLGTVAPWWKDFPDARAIYWQNGAPAAAGDTIVNVKLAATLGRIAELGAPAFYAGETAQSIVAGGAGAKVNPGDMTLLDLTAYRARERAAVCAPYRSYRICGMGPPSSGAVTVIQILGQLERFDMAALGPNSLEAWHLIGESMRLAYADRDKWLADPDFVTVPTEGLIDPAYLKTRSALIDAKKARADYPAGTPPLPEPMAEEPVPVPSSETAGTTHFVAIDAAGNVASMTSTVEGPFGSQLVAAGMVLNNELTDFSFVPVGADTPDGLVANRVQAGKRPLSSMSPTIVFDAAGKPVLALGSAGGKRIIMHVAKTLVGVIDFGLPLDQAIAMPNIYFSGDTTLVEKGSGLEPNVAALAAFGHKVEAIELPSKVNGAQLTAAGWRGAADPRSAGTSSAE